MHHLQDCRPRPGRPHPPGSTETQRAPCRVGSGCSPDASGKLRGSSCPLGPGARRKPRGAGTWPWSLEGGITPSSMETRRIWCLEVLSRWPAAWGVEEAPWTPRGGEADHQASPDTPRPTGPAPPNLAAPRGTSFTPPASRRQVWSASAQMRRRSAGQSHNPGWPLQSREGW